jgi:hypothetical protein
MASLSLSPSQWQRATHRPKLRCQRWHVKTEDSDCQSPIGCVTDQGSADAVRPRLTRSLPRDRRKNAFVLFGSHARSVAPEVVEHLTPVADARLDLSTGRLAAAEEVLVLSLRSGGESE